MHACMYVCMYVCMYKLRAQYNADTCAHQCMQHTDLLILPYVTVRSVVIPFRKR